MASAATNQKGNGVAEQSHGHGQLRNANCGSDAATTTTDGTTTTNSNTTVEIVEDEYDPIAVVTEPLNVAAWRLPRLELPPREALELIEAFVAKVVQENSGTTEQRDYKTLLQTIKIGPDSRVRYMVLLALRSSGPTLHRLATSNQNSKLVHFLMRVDPFEVPSPRNGQRVDETYYQDYRMADAYLHLLLAFLSSNSVFLHPILSHLWKMLALSKTVERTGRLAEERTNRLHGAIRSALRICPRGHTELFPIVQRSMPFRNAPIKTIVWYCKQCLTVLESVPSMQRQVFDLLIEKALEIDVEIRIDDGGQVSLEQQQGKGLQKHHDILDGIETDCAQEGIFEIDLGNKAGGGNDSAPRQPATSASDLKVDEMADKVRIGLFRKTRALQKGKKECDRMPVFHVGWRHTYTPV